MKNLKTLFFSLALCAPLTAAAQDIEINEENFPDANFRNYLLEQDYGADGVITEEEIAGISEIYVTYKGNISSLKGIEHFTALTELYCYQNQLTALDVSNNTALTYLDCGNNQITALDVSNNTELTYLSCNSNQLTALDVSNNTALTTLACSENQLTALDVSNNTALTTLACYSNQLTALDVSNNTELWLLECSSNQLTTLNVLNNTELTDLNCGFNQLTALDVSNNTELTSLGCFSNQLMALDVSGCTALTGLNCGFNQLTALNVSGCTALTSLNCYSNQIKGESMDALVSSLPETANSGLYVYSEASYDNESNIITKSQVAVAKAKGWTPYYYGLTEWGWYDWQEYEGMDDTATSVTLPEAENSTAAVYTLQGQKVTAPQKGGIYVVNGKKVVVK